MSFGSLVPATTAMTAPPPGVTLEQHAALRNIISQWLCADKKGKKIMTLAYEALEILRGIGWVSKRLLPNDVVGSLVRYRSFPPHTRFLTA